MATYEHELTPPPKPERGRELWIQHAAGFILFEDSRAYAIERIDPRLDATARAAAVKAIDDALYGLMMIIDGATGSLANECDVISLSMVARHSRKLPDGSAAPVMELDLGQGDGMCMGVHGWKKGDFGTYPPVVVRPPKPRRKAKPQESLTGRRLKPVR
jgi:hypothetical protein